MCLCLPEGPSVSPVSRSREMQIWVQSDDDNFTISVDLDGGVAGGCLCFFLAVRKKTFQVVHETVMTTTTTRIKIRA